MELQQKILGGAEFLVAETPAENVFIPEQFNEEQRMVADMAKDFIMQKVRPVDAELEKHNLDLLRKLLEEAGELGLLGTAFPEEYGGSAQDFLTNMLLTETMSQGLSFALTHGAHTGIGMLPILYFGNTEQKAKYLPDLISGVKKAAYCLTEPGSGSDALAAKTKAMLSDDGKHYIISGQKMWITNGGIADVFVVFAQIDGDKFTGFIVEAALEGVSRGAEEAKLGVKGSSTCQIFFENVKVPVENVLGDIGKGHRIAFNILNIGRIKLGAGALGGAKMAADFSVKYANERQQFKQSISNFGAIKHKLAEQAIRMYSLESAVYRASDNIQEKEDQLLAEGKSHGEALLGAAEEYAVECALLKVAGSEVLDYVVDEGLQIYGGMGYSEEAPMARAYRDARINRIFEGTNEINRMLSIDMLMKRAMKGTLDIMTPAMAVQQELMSPPSANGHGANGSIFTDEKYAVKDLKKAFLMTAGATVQKLMQALKDEQEILMYLADMMMDIYVAESVILRVEKLISLRGQEACAAQIDIAKVFVSDANERIALNARNCIRSWAEGDNKMMLIKGLRRFTKYEGVNAKAARRRIAQVLIDADEYCF